ncbi:MAG: porin family protein [Saprospiraceae bacterium]|nr:PorT family protein [Saprospiraceae bacterium]MDW8230025.1 porin family protein [Saprospiraceae bacterium]
MKLHSFILLLFLGASALPLHAQMTDGKLRFGLRLGVTGSNLYDDAKAQDRNGRVGLLGGAFVKIPLGNSNFSLRPEVLYATKGATFKRDSFISSIKSSYIEVPLSLEYNLSIVNLHAGLNASLLANANGEFKDEQGNPINFDKEDLEKLDLGWHLGAGLDLGNIGLHLRINRGLKNVGGGQTLSGLVGDLKNSAWSLTLVYGF